MSGLLVVNADDLGVTRGATNGIVKAHRDGILTSASLAVTTDSYGHAVDACHRLCPDLGIGLHFTLTSGKPAARLGDVPLLVGGDGFFRWRFLSLLASSSTGRRRDLLEQVDIELEAQLQRMIADGLRPDHIDGERHVHLIPAVFDRVVAAARRHRVPFVRAGREAGRSMVTARDAVGLLANGGFVKEALLSTLSAGDRGRLREIRTPDRVASYLYTGRPDLFLSRLLGAPPMPGITEVMVHPGLPEESRGAALGNRELERYVASDDRRLELDAVVDARERTGTWTLTNYRRLANEPRS